MRKQTKLVAVLSAAALLAIGASMTSFAATRGWVMEGEDWVYLDNNGDRVYNQWKRSGDNYYYLNEDGVMATDSLIHDETVDAWYYVDANGVKLMNSWKDFPNEDGEQVGDNTPDVLYYFFGATGKAERATGDDLKVKEIGGKYYAFDTEGRMASGWQKVVLSNGNEYLYYFGTELEGWAYTEWAKLEPGENMRHDDYDDLEWYWFGTNGRAAMNTSKYINGRYYHFDENGVMDDGWYDPVNVPPTAASAAIAYASENGTLSAGWVYTTAKDDPDGDEYWFYLVTLRDGNSVARSVPYNYFGTGFDRPTLGPTGIRAKVIKNKTYIFDNAGKMMDGFVYIGNNPTTSPLGKLAGTQAFDSADFTSANYGNINGRDLEDGLYYFNEAGGSVNGQMMTGRTAVTIDGDVFYFYFNKSGNQNTAANYGKALTSTVKDGYLYGVDGKCLEAEDGNSYAVYKVSDVADDWDVTGSDGSVTTVSGIKVAGKSTIIDETIPTTDVDGAYVVVSQSGRIKQSGTATIDGIRYTIKNYKVTNTKVID